MDFKMTRFLKQCGKALLYMGTMVGMQFVAYFIFLFYFIYDLMTGLGATTGELSTDQMEDLQFGLTYELYDFLLAGTNWIYILYGVLTLAFFWFIFAIRKKKLLREANVVPFPFRKIIPILLLAISSSLMIQTAFSLFPIPEEILSEYDQAVEMAMEGSTLMIVITNVFVAPIVEEITFRGLALSRLRKVMPVTVAAILTSSIFGLIHGQILWICYATLLGLMMSFIAVQCESVLASILFHMVFNLIGSFPEYITPVSPEGVVIAGVIGLAVSIIIIIWMIKDKKEGLSE